MAIQTALQGSMSGKAWTLHCTHAARRTAAGALAPTGEARRRAPCQRRGCPVQQALHCRAEPAGRCLLLLLLLLLLRRLILHCRVAGLHLDLPAQAGSPGQQTLAASDHCWPSAWALVRAQLLHC